MAIRYGLVEVPEPAGFVAVCAQSEKLAKKNMIKSMFFFIRRYLIFILISLIVLFHFIESSIVTPSLYKK